ncbi:family 43 glycosylhydrolase [Microbacterium sp. ZW T5_45]|uniref:glycoside hydrolase family 43 protein n=1 Tax=Microbacterium sp. ZW T5_45 TaxID=3378080 RepID=UPI003853ED84
MTLPILPGFYPDPSICRVGETYYLANSTFEYVPGVPIHRSDDLLSWELIGHALPDAEVVNAEPGSGGASQGIFAPTLRHHDGLFFLTTTSIRDVGRGQLIVTATDPAGPWSAPVYVPDTPGIDPDLAWAEDGTCLLTWRGFAPSGIHQVAIDPITGERLGEETMLWEGTGLADTEGPHLFRRGDWWYLVVAEGGTHLGHGVSIARSRDPRGPFDAHPANPIFSHRSLEHDVQATGHPDLVELADGSWAMVYLGIRPAGAFPRFHVNGRETFLAGISWQDDWPVVDEDRFDVPTTATAFDDRFDADALHPRWIAPSIPPASVATPGGALTPSRTPDETDGLAVLATRVRDLAWNARAAFTGDACLGIRISGSHWYGVESIGDVIRVRAVVGPLAQVVITASSEDGDVLAIRSRREVVLHDNTRGPDDVFLGVERSGAFVELAGLDGRYISTEVAGGFTGRMLTVEALAEGVSVTRVGYEPAPANG